MKKLIYLICVLASFSITAQEGGFEGGNYGGPKPTGSTRTLLEELRLRTAPPTLSINRGGGVSIGGGIGGPTPIDDSRLNPNTGGGFGGYGGGPRKLDLTPGDLNAGSVATGGSSGLPGTKPTTNSATINRIGAIGSTYSHDQAVSILTNARDLINRKYDKEEVLPTRLHIESINLSSDEVTEITLKDGSVVKVEDLQEFVRQKMKEKLNQ